MRRSFRHASLAALVAVATAGFSSAALAHVGDHSQMGFAEGLLHPFSGLDHMLISTLLVSGGVVLRSAG